MVAIPDSQFDRRNDKRTSRWPLDLKILRQFQDNFRSLLIIADDSSSKDYHNSNCLETAQLCVFSISLWGSASAHLISKFQSSGRSKLEMQSSCRPQGHLENWNSRWSSDVINNIQISVPRVNTTTLSVSIRYGPTTHNKIVSSKQLRDDSWSGQNIGRSPDLLLVLYC